MENIEVDRKLFDSLTDRDFYKVRTCKAEALVKAMRGLPIERTGPIIKFITGVDVRFIAHPVINAWVRKNSRDLNRWMAEQDLKKAKARVKRYYQP